MAISESAEGENERGLMDDGILILLLVIFALVCVAFVIAAIVAIIRWLFKINEIETFLKNIYSAIQKQSSNSAEDDASLPLCDGCNENFDETLLKKIDSGQMLCPECSYNLKKKNQ
ncbi:MAG: hypothetical protein PHY02_01985 [Phycisphaerae bacterium]|nr:hypothetical protein [Phycisphaerae bacterium]